MQLGGLNFIVMSYNVEDAAVWPFPAAKVTIVSFSAINNGVASFNDTLILANTSNTFWGMTRFSISNQASLDIRTSFIPFNSITGYSNNPFSNLDFQVMMWEFKECDPTTPYYMIAEDMCYNPCPPRYFQQSSD